MLVPGVLRQNAASSVIGLCSTLPGEGTTTVVSGLACAIAEAHLDVVVVNGRGSAPGDSDAGWASAAADEGLTRHIEIVELERRADAGGAAQLCALVNHSRLRARVVLLDMDPLKVSPQVLSAANCVDAIYLVVEADRERREVVTRSVESLTRAGHHVAGLVLNKRARPIPEFLYRWL